MHSYFLKSFLTETLHFSGCWLFLKKSKDCRNHKIGCTFHLEDSLGKVTFIIFFARKICCKFAKIIVHFRWFMIYFCCCCLLSVRSIEFDTLLGFLDDSALRKNKFLLSLIVFLYCFLPSRYF